ncbi:transketolase [Orenia metallireducens]|uniref:Transketolase n=1 Tax=Orenia metallireducens TaxID=1413210 RepID=A0A1C0A5I3_9FIRM|nr:transketolase [Orenia metallireducens]OCL25395.1 transketolase [Orenia metallireducens]
MLERISNIVRGLSADAIEKAGSGHPGLPLGCAEIGTVLFSEIMNHNPKNPAWPNRDRFVLSAGHGSMLLYSLLHLTGYDLTIDDLKEYKQLHSKTPGHPEYKETPGIETTTGPLGQGFANAVGMAIAEKMLADRYNTEEFEIIDYYTYTLMGDGCMMEGITSEAASLAGHLGLGKLIAIYDDNDISIEGSTDITFTESVADRYRAYNWHVVDNIDGHDINAIKEAILKAKSIADKPSLIIAKTHIGYGAPNKQGTSAAHGAPLGAEEIKGMKEKLGLPVEQKFYVADEVREHFTQRNKELQKLNKKWQDKFAQWAKANPKLKEKWDQAQNLELPDNFEEVVNQLEIEAPIATRSASGLILEKIVDEVPYLVGGSADLGPSNKTYLERYSDIQKNSFAGRNFRFGIREHAMGAIANGLALSGLRPFTATFLVFSDYMRGAIRMSALMGLPAIYVFTHDSIYVGGDGPTHQPIEHLASLRAIPNLAVIRPADEEETKEAWISAMKKTDGPTALVLSRQELPHIDKISGTSDFSKGGYVVSKEQESSLDVSLLATGSEVALASEVAKLLREKNLNVRVISVPNREQFLAQDQDYIVSTLGDKDVLKVVIEAGVSQGWYSLLEGEDYVVSIEDFGLSAPGEMVAKEFGFDVKKIANDIINKFD